MTFNQRYDTIAKTTAILCHRLPVASGHRWPVLACSMLGRAA